jgi:hypothetical protein
MTEYNHTLTTTADVKKLNLQNMQQAIRIAELEKENKALKDKLAQIIIKDNKPCN